MNIFPPEQIALMKAALAEAANDIRPDSATKGIDGRTGFTCRRGGSSEPGGVQIRGHCSSTLDRSIKQIELTDVFNSELARPWIHWQQPNCG